MRNIRLLFQIDDIASEQGKWASRWSPGQSTTVVSSLPAVARCDDFYAEDF